MPEILDEERNLESSTVLVSRTAATVKGGRRFSFNSMVVVGDRRGQVGLGYGKANEVPPAIEKAQKEARKSMMRVPLKGGTIPHEALGRFGSARVKLIPASPGTGVVAGAAVRAVLEMAGVTDCLTKCYGSTNKQNVVKAVIEGLRSLRTRDEVASVRGVDLPMTVVDEMIERGKVFAAPAAEAGERAKAPVNTVGQSRGGGGGGRGSRGGRGGGRGRRSGGPSREKPQQSAASGAAEKPAADASQSAESGGEPQT